MIDKTLPIEKYTDQLISSAYKDQNENVWIGTPNGLQYLNFQSGTVKIKEYSTNDGLSHDYINAITASPQEDLLWISTNYGLNVFDLQKQAFTSFYKEDGLASNSFSPNGVYRANDGQIFFSSIGGLTYFYSDSIKIGDDQPSLAITGIKINDDQHVKIGESYWGDVLLEQPLNKTKRITLNHYINKITFTFSTLDFFASSKATYQYKLEGYNDKWVSLNNTNTFSFSNLKSGTYTLLLRNSDDQKIQTSLSIDIIPSPWVSTGAITVYSLLLIIIGFGIFKLLSSQTNLRNKLKIEKVTREKERELNQLKLQFFTNISHELRTPLTLIAGPIEDLLAQETGNNSFQDRVRLMKRNVRRLLRLSDQLITFRKVEVEKMTLNLSEEDFVNFCRDIYQLFKLSSGDDKYRFHFHSEFENVSTFFDLQVMETIIYNLVSNAIKFSKKEGGDITIAISKDTKLNEHLVISVTDSGIGIAQNEVEKVFDRFYQLGHSSLNAGAGIGLSLVKRLVEMHRGQVKVESTIGEGTMLSVSLPFIDKNWYQKLDRSRYQKLHQKPEWVPKYNEEEIQDLVGIEEPTDIQNVDKSKESLLIVDDNDDLRTYLEKIFGSIYDVHQASNGLDALRVLDQQSIDLIITDIMMDQMDGVEFCKKIKVTSSYSHLPIVILSAKVEIEDLLGGLQIGADDYVEKPFNPEVLKAKVKNLLDKKKELRRYYRQEFLMEPEQGEIENLEEKFILKVKGIVEDNITDSNKIKLLIQEQMAMSKPTFYKKLKSLTGYSLTEFIRSIRVKKASFLLASSSHNISQIAYSMGFNDLKYFRTCFESEFHQTPSKYRNSYKKSSILEKE